MLRSLQFQIRAIATLAAVLAAGACEDLATPTVPTEDPAPLQGVIACRADVVAGAISCQRPTVDPASGLSLSVEILGGQGTYVRLASNNVSYDGSDVFQADVTVQNLLTQPIGTSDGTTVAGILVFVHSGPVVTSGTGTVTVANADGRATITGADQPFFRYDTILQTSEVSAARTWQWSVPSTVATFEFSVYVLTEIADLIAFLSDDPRNSAKALYTALPDGSDVRLMMSGAYGPKTPELSPDGRWIAYSRVYSAVGWGIFAVSTTDLSENLIAVQNVTAPGGITWSPDGQQLAYEAGGRIRIVNFNGTDNRILVDWLDPVSGSMSWSPDGSSLAFTLGGSSLHDDMLAVVDVNTGQAVWQSGFSLNADLVDPAFSHLGDALAFATLNAVDDDIFLLVFETGLLTRLPIPGHQRAPVWSPRGDALLFQSDHDGDWELYLWNGSTLTNVTQNSAADDTYPSWQWLAGPTPASSPGTAPSSLLRSIQSEGVASWRFAPREVGGPELGRLPPEDDSGPATGR